MTRILPWLLAGLIAGPGAMTGEAAGKKPVRVSVSSRVAPAYQRTKLADGTFKREFYALSDGGAIEGTTRDEGMDQVPFSMIAGVVAEHLAAQNYLLAPDAKSADLLLMIRWGRTIPFNGGNYNQAIQGAATAMQNVATMGAGGGPNRETGDALSPEARAAQDEFEGAIIALEMENRFRDQLNEANARILGYLDEINEHNDIRRWAGGGDTYDELRLEIEESRYYVVVFAYDFRKLTRQKEKQLLWITRISIRAQGNQFGQHLEAMIARAGRYFGRDSGRLVRDYEGTVEIGEARVVGYADEPTAPVPPPADEKRPDARKKKPAPPAQP